MKHAVKAVNVGGGSASAAVNRHLSQQGQCPYQQGGSLAPVVVETRDGKLRKAVRPAAGQGEAMQAGGGGAAPMVVRHLQGTTFGTGMISPAIVRHLARGR